MSPALCKHWALFGWWCLTYSILDILGIPVTSNCWIELGVLLNWLRCAFCFVWLHLVGAVTVGVEPVNMVSGRVRAPLALQRGVYPTCCLYYGLFRHNNTHGCGLPFGILWENWDGKWRLFMIQPVRIISSFMQLSHWGHEPHCRMFPFIFIIFFWITQRILLQWLLYNRFFKLSLESNYQFHHLYWGV